MNNNEKNNITKIINQAFNYRVRNVDYFYSALTHKSTSIDNYERLEILGDSVIASCNTESPKISNLS